MATIGTRFHYEIGGIALVKGARNPEAAKRYYDWLMSPAGQSIGAKANSLQVPANKTFKPDPRIPPVDNVGPRVVRAESISDTEVIVSFSEPLNSEAANPLNFSIDPALTVIDARMTLSQNDN